MENQTYRCLMASCVVIMDGETRKCLDILFKDNRLYGVWEKPCPVPVNNVNTIEQLIAKYGETYYVDHSHYQDVKSGKSEPCLFREMRAIDKILSNGENTDYIPKVLDLPLTVDEIRSMLDEHDNLTAIIKVDLSDIINLDIEGLNDLIDELTLSEGFLSATSWEIVGYESDNIVYLEVSGIYNADIDYAVDEEE